MRVLQVGKYYPPYFGGIESHVAELATAIHQRRVEVEVLVSNDKPETVEESIAGVPVLRAGTMAKVASTPISPAMLSRLFAIDHDVVHVHLPSPLTCLALLLSRPKAKLVVTYHSDIVKQRFLAWLIQPILNQFLKRASAIIVGSPTLLSTSPVLQKHKDRCRVVPFGVDQSWCAEPEVEATKALRKKYGERIVLAVGRQVYYKGFEYLIEAMSKVDAHLLLAGDGPLRGQLEDKAQNLGLQDKVTFLGKVPDKDLRACYHAADVFVLPSIEKSEAFGLVQVEAMAAGTPVINTWLDSAVPFVSLDGETGVTVEPRDSNAISAALQELFDNPALRHKYAESARQRAESMFSVAAMTDATLSIYREALGSENQTEVVSAAATA